MCIKSKTPIAKGELRVGSLVPEAGTYGRWTRLSQWRVPAAFKAVREAPSIEDGLMVAHLAVEEHYARETKKKALSVMAETAAEAVREAIGAGDDGNRQRPAPVRCGCGGSAE